MQRLFWVLPLLVVAAAFLVVPGVATADTVQTFDVQGALTGQFSGTLSGQFTYTYSPNQPLNTGYSGISLVLTLPGYTYTGETFAETPNTTNTDGNLFLSNSASGDTLELIYVNGIPTANPNPIPFIGVNVELGGGNISEDLNGALTPVGYGAVPEISASTAPSALALVAGAILIIRRRRKISAPVG